MSRGHREEIRRDVGRVGSICLKRLVFRTERVNAIAHLYKRAWRTSSAA
jgi:hypothetical protein